MSTARWGVAGVAPQIHACSARARRRTAVCCDDEWEKRSRAVWIIPRHAASAVSVSMWLPALTRPFGMMYVSTRYVATWPNSSVEHISSSGMSSQRSPQRAESSGSASAMCFKNMSPMAAWFFFWPSHPGDSPPGTISVVLPFGGMAPPPSQKSWDQSVVAWEGTRCGPNASPARAKSFPCMLCASPGFPRIRRWWREALHLELACVRAATMDAESSAQHGRPRSAPITPGSGGARVRPSRGVRPSSAHHRAAPTYAGAACAPAAPTYAGAACAPADTTTAITAPAVAGAAWVRAEAGRVDTGAGLSFDEFRAFAAARHRKGASQEDEEQLLHADYIQYRLRDAITRRAAHVAQLFYEFDADGSGFVDRGEFRRAVRAVLDGFAVDATDADIDAVYADFDDDNSGLVSRFELEKRMRQYAGLSVEQRFGLRREAGGRVGAALSTTVALDRHSGEPVAQQLRAILADNAVRVIDLFRDWDTDADGTVSRREFERALHALGLRDVSDAELSELFGSFDPDSSGTVEFSELHKLLRRRVGDRAAESQRRRSHRTPPACGHRRAPASPATEQQQPQRVVCSPALQRTMSAMVSLAQSRPRLSEEASHRLHTLQSTATKDNVLRRAHSTSALRFGGELSLAEGLSSAAAQHSRPAPSLKRELIRDLSSVWLMPQSNARRHAWQSQPHHTRNLLPPRLAAQVAPRPQRHRPAPRHGDTLGAASLRSWERLRALQEGREAPEDTRWQDMRDPIK